MFGFVGKWLAYHAKEKVVDPRLFEEVDNIWVQHDAELEDFARQTRPDEIARFVDDFLRELRKWPREFREFSVPAPEGSPEAISEGFRLRMVDGINMAYAVGYMVGKGWISKEHSFDYTRHLGDRLARDVRSVLKGAKSKGYAFSCGFARVAACGYSKALQFKAQPRLWVEHSASVVGRSVRTDATVSKAEPLEEISLPQETLVFLIKILRKVMEAKPSEEQLQQDRSARIHVLVDELHDHKKIFDAGNLLLTQMQQAHHDNDLRRAIGWLAWFLVLKIYSERHIPDSDTKEEETRKHYNDWTELLKSTMDVARTAKQCDALLLAAGLCDWAGLEKWSDQTLVNMRDEIGKQAMTERLLNIKHQPLMLLDDFLVSRVQHYLGDS